MTRLTKNLLRVGVMGTVSGGIIDFGNFTVPPYATAALPLGAVFLALAFIFGVLEGPSAEFDREAAARE